MSDTAWPRFALAVWDVGLNTLSNLVVGLVTAELFDVRQSKRLGGVINSGRSVAIAVGGLSVPLILRVVGPTSMYTVACVAFIAAALVLTRIRTHHHRVFATRAPARPPAG